MCAKQYVNISDQEIESSKSQSNQSCLQEEKGGVSFDVGMGTFDSA